LIAETPDRAEGLRDQSADQRDQSADQRDQAADQRDQAADQRDQAADQRDQAADQRDQAADQRDQAAERRDQAADQRDQAAERRDQAAEQSEARVKNGGLITDALNRSGLARRDAAYDRHRASQDRRAGASERDQADLDRESALADRAAGATERTQAELDRNSALADRGASAGERESSFLDDLTGVYHRGAGFAELEREVARARRAEQPLVLAFVDVDRLKNINDSRGHAAGDQMLIEVANSLRAKLRSHDLIIRYGGDEFVCAISGIDMAEATKRLNFVNAALAQAPGLGSVTVGLAELEPDDTPDDLVARADAMLYRERQQKRPT
jgi:diguanylate cyclase (GGDEF)-like protein